MGSWGVGQPQSALLDGWAREVKAAFGETPYMVGSACNSTAWRDVDVVLILNDEKWDHLFGPYDAEKPIERQRGVAGGWHNPFLSAMQVAFSVWGREATGLPIDFKIQRLTEANTEHSGPRNALGITPIKAGLPAWRT